MRKGFLAICLVLVVLLAALAPSCGPTTGTIVVKATICGAPWPGALNYTLTPTTGSPVSGTTVPFTHSGVAASTWTCAYVSGGPGAAYFLKSIKPSGSQSLSGGGTITFTLDFELKQDAGILFKTWTVNGNSIPGSTWQGEVCQIIDAHFQQWVDGCTAYNVTLNETAWLTITQTGGPPGPPMMVYVANNLCAVNKTTPPQGLPPVKKSQEPSVNNVTRQQGYTFNLTPQVPTQLDVKTVWQLVKCLNYTKSINWFGISKAPFEPLQPPHLCVLFELVLPMQGQYTFTLVASAEVTLVDDKDWNPANNSTMSPQLFLTVTVP